MRPSVVLFLVISASGCQRKTAPPAPTPPPAPRLATPEAAEANIDAGTGSSLRWSVTSADGEAVLEQYRSEAGCFLECRIGAAEPLWSTPTCLGEPHDPHFVGPDCHTVVGFFPRTRPGLDSATAPLIRVLRDGLVLKVLTAKDFGVDASIWLGGVHTRGLPPRYDQGGAVVAFDVVGVGLPTQTIELSKPRPAPTPIVPANQPAGYLWFDGRGGTHIAFRLEEVPSEHRERARPLDEAQLRAERDQSQRRVDAMYAPPPPPPSVTDFGPARSPPQATGPSDPDLVVPPPGVRRVIRIYDPTTQRWRTEDMPSGPYLRPGASCRLENSPCVHHALCCSKVCRDGVCREAR